MTVDMEKNNDCDGKILKRLFISNLPSDVTEKKLLDFFPKNVQLSDVEIKHKNEGERFAFVSVKGKVGAINTCIRQLPSCHLNGRYLKVQFAKQSFLERLKSERQNADHQDNSATCTSEATKEETFSKRFEKREVSLKVEKEPSSEDSSSDEDMDQSSSNTLRGKCLKMQFPKRSSPVKHESSVQSKGLQEDGTHARVKKKEKIKLPSMMNEDYPKEGSTSAKTEEKPNKGELKRIQSLEKRNQLYHSQASAIKNALKSTGPPVNKKVKFDYDDEENITEEKEVSSEGNAKKKFKLFEDSGEEEGEEEFNFDAKKPMFKIVQTKYSTCDERFKLTDKFIEEDDEKAPDIEIDEELDNELKIVDSILGTNTEPKFRIKDTKINESLHVRYDPLITSHRKFVKNTDEQSTEAAEKTDLKKREKKNKKNVEKESTTNSEKYYHFSNSLADTFKSSNDGFRLTDIFSGDKKASENENESVSQEDSGTSLPTFVKNQFFSTGDEDECSLHEEEGDMNEETEGDKNESKEIFNKPLFFYPDDERLKESLDFFNTPLSETGSFSAERSMLNKIVFHKIKRFNTNLNNKSFKNKLSSKKKFYQAKKK